MLRTAALIAAITVVMGATEAQATPAPIPYVPAAIQWWGQGQPPPCGQPIFQMVKTDITELGDATYETCVVNIDKEAWTDMPSSMRCRLIFHELGHLYGFGHTPTGIMEATIYVGPFTVCDRLTVAKASKHFDSR